MYLIRLPTCIIDVQILEHFVDVLRCTNRFQLQDVIQTKVNSSRVHDYHFQVVYFEQNGIYFSSRKIHTWRKNSVREHALKSQKRMVSLTMVHIWSKEDIDEHSGAVVQTY